MFEKVADQGAHTVRLKIYRLPNFYSMLFQLVLTKFFESELFSCLRKVAHVINLCKRPLERFHSRDQHLKQKEAFT